MNEKVGGRLAGKGSSLDMASNEIQSTGEQAEPLKSTQDGGDEQPEVTVEGGIKLQKSVTLVQGIALIVGAMIGSGIFISPKGVLIRSGSIGLSLVVWTGCGILSLFGALSYAEMGTMIPKSGADYAYFSEAFGTLPAFLYSWTLLLVIKPSALAIVALTFGNYVSQPFFSDCEPPMHVRKVLGALCLALTMFVNCFSVTLATKVQNIFTAAKLLACGILTVVGIYELAIGEVSHFEGSFDSEVTQTNAAEIALAFYAGLWAYDGWNNLNFVTEELKNPYRDLPRAIIIGIPLVTVVYVLVNIAYVAVVGRLGVLNADAVAIDVGHLKLGPVWWMIPIFVACSTFGAVNGMAFSTARLVFVAARNKHMPSLLAMIHTKRLTPMPGVIFLHTVAIIMLMPDASNFMSLVNYFSFATWLSYFGVFCALLWMRYKRPDLHRPIKVWIFIPIIAAVLSLYLLIMPFQAEFLQTFLALLFVLAGIPVYILFCWSNVIPQGFHDAIENFTWKMQKLCDLAPPGIASAEEDQPEEVAKPSMENGA